jgi:hypothetical protein
MTASTGSPRRPVITSGFTLFRSRQPAQLRAVEEVKGGVQATIRVSVEIDGEERPGCVVDTISRYYPA